MQVTTNDKLIRRRSKLGTYASLGGLGVLVAGFVASFQQNLIWVSLIAIVARLHSRPIRQLQPAPLGPLAAA